MHNMQMVAAARSWLGTRFHHQGRLKRNENHRGGVDCLGLLVCIADELDIKTPRGEKLSSLDKTDYSHYPNSEELKATLSSVMSELSMSEIIAGDILLMNIDGNAQHLAIVGSSDNGLSLIHAYAPARAVVEHGLDDWWKAKIDSIYRFSNYYP